MPTDTETPAAEKHTPGPWRVDAGFLRDVQTQDGSLEIATARSPDDGPFFTVAEEVAHANARLIAAAPCMLAALRELLAVVNPRLAAAEVEQARAAIAKATTP